MAAKKSWKHARLYKIGIRENIILLITSGGATYRHYALSIYAVLVVIHKCLDATTDGSA